MTAQGARAPMRPRPDLVELAASLAEADEVLRSELIAARREAGLSQREVADLLGIKQSSVAAFERHDNDPRLSTIRRYALAVGARIEHRVTTEGDLSTWSPVELHYASLIHEARDQVVVPAPAHARCTDFAVAA